MIDRARFETISFATLRIVAGVLFLFHGVQKIFGLLTTKATPDLGSQLWFGGVIELICGTFIAFGIFTRYAAFLASGTMAVAYIQFHWKGELGDKFFPAANGGDAALLYCFLFLYIWIRGAGPISIDRKLGRSIAP